jgi:hypothetical protein
MNKRIIIAVVLLLGSVLSFSEEGVETGIAGDSKRNVALLWRPLSTLDGALRGFYAFTLEGEIAFSRHWALDSIVDLRFNNEFQLAWLQVGPQFRPKGEYLKGFLMGISPGILYGTVFSDEAWLATLTLEAGYQWIFRSGFVLGLTAYGTCLLYPVAGLLAGNISALVGYAF